MRLSWSVGLPGPFRVGGTFRRRPAGDGLIVTTLAYVIVGVVVAVYVLGWLLVAAATGLWRLGVLVARKARARNRRA